MNQTEYFSIKFENDNLTFLDQTKLPLEEVYIETDNLERIAQAIKRLEVRGAPLIGISAAYALALSLKNVNDDHEKFFNSAYKRLAETRPTAVNLFTALNDLKEEFEKLSDKKNVYETLLSKAKEIHKKDEEFCTKIGRNGLSLFKQKSNVLTHCNTGKLATSGIGTAFGIIKTAFENGLVDRVFADETRPLLQGLRLTAFELEKCGIPFTLQTDSSAAELMKQGKVDLVVTGADRVALNGDSANKIGTYNLAILASYHKIPFYIGDTLITPEHYEAFTPAFDVTPSHLITGIITEEGVFSFPYNFLQ